MEKIETIISSTIPYSPVEMAQETSQQIENTSTVNSSQWSAILLSILVSLLAVNTFYWYVERVNKNRLQQNKNQLPNSSQNLSK